MFDNKIKKLDRKHYILLVILIITVALLVFFSNAKGAFSIGSYYFGGGAYNLPLAKSFLNLAYKIDDKYPVLNYQIARIYFIEGEFDKALASINKEIEFNPEYKRSYYVRALIHGYDDNLPQAAEDFKTFLAWKPVSWAGNNDLSWIYFRMGDYVAAEKAAREGLKASPTNPWVLNSLGVALLNQGKYEESTLALEKSLAGFKALDPLDWGRSYPGNNPEIYKDGLNATIGSVETNLALAEQKDKGLDD